jgi:nucleotide-binding universal stress UspA family protein
MLTQRRKSSSEDGLLRSSANRPVLLATLDVPFAEDAMEFAVDSAVETGQALVVVNVAEVVPTTYTLLGYGYIERDDLQAALRRPAELAHSLAVRVERLRVCSPHPVDALLEVVAERDPGVLVFGPDLTQLKPRRYRRAATKIRERTSCLLWLA